MPDVNGNASKDKDIDRLRIRDLNKLARFRHSDGNGDYILPDNDEGRIIASAIITHQRFKPITWLFRFCNERAPWLDPDEIDRSRLYPKETDALGQELRLPADLRDQLRIRTIGACDQTKTERAAIAKAKKRERDRERRRQGRQRRAEYIASHATSRTRPWEQQGISRRTWYRRRGTSMSPQNTFTACDTPVPALPAWSPDGPPAYTSLAYLLRVAEYRKLTSGGIGKIVPGLAACSELRRVAA
jgi:hypothetical protein